MRDSNAIPLNPKKYAIDKNTQGSTINLPNTTIAVSFMYFFISEKEKEAPRRTKDKGVAIFDKSLIAIR